MKPYLKSFKFSLSCVFSLENSWVSPSGRISLFARVQKITRSEKRREMANKGVLNRNEAHVVYESAYYNVRDELLVPHKLHSTVDNMLS